MSGVCYHFTTAASTNLQPVRAGQSANLKSVSICNVATAVYLHFYWVPGTSAPPTVGTTVPNLTLASSTTTLSPGTWYGYPDGITGNGQLWVAVTGGAADNDASNATAAAVITLTVE